MRRPGSACASTVARDTPTAILPTHPAYIVIFAIYDSHGIGVRRFAFARLDESRRLAWVGELCRFLEFGTIVMALSSKPVILAVPAQVRQAARVS
ncbi:hypothetical protein [Paraburkholderia sp. HP33-1]|uniref:hypothetical protein n=1 Tax=Paraburkholderia sp. HP33-1 TaxID=2883243 RepID=UPI001F214CB5|nr:hypothetical protein [Paraburkholderia sp. HP33-1]